MAKRDSNDDIVSTRSKSGKKTTVAGGWSGNAVARAPGGEAEEAALRAEGNGPHLVRDVLEGNRSDPDRSTAKLPATKLSDQEMKKAQQLKQEAAAEEHRAVQAERGTGPHGRL